MPFSDNKNKKCGEGRGERWARGKHDNKHSDSSGEEGGGANRQLAIKIDVNNIFNIILCEIKFSLL